jgi:hypothetical protein
MALQNPVLTLLANKFICSQFSTLKSIAKNHFSLINPRFSSDRCRCVYVVFGRFLPLVELKKLRRSLDPI